MFSQTTYYLIGGIIVQAIAPKHSNDIQPLINIEHYDFRDNLFLVFSEHFAFYAKRHKL